MEVSKPMKIIFITLFIFSILFLAFGFAAGNYFYTLALIPDSDKSAVFNASHNVIEWKVDDEEIRKYEERKSWYSSNDPTNLYIRSVDNLKLHASAIYSEEPSNLWLITCHGYGGSGSQMIEAGKWFHEKGFNILMPDARSSGKSEGHYIGMGWHDRLDLLSWIDEIVKQDADSQIILHGVSMGAATVMMVSGEDLPDNVKAIIEDCGYTSVWDEFAYQLEELFGFPAFPIMNFSSAVAKLRAGFSLKEASAIEQVAKSETPMLFIHGEQDSFVPSYMVEEVYQAANCPKEKLIIKDAGHGMSSQIDSDAYWSTVDSFVSYYIK